MTIFIARTAAIALVSSTARTQVQVVSSTKPVRVKEVGISFDGIDATKTPVLAEIVRQTTAGTSSSLTVVENQEIGETPLLTALSTFSSTEPTTTDVLRSWYITPAGGLWVMQFPLGDEIVIGPSGRLAIRLTPGATTTNNAISYLVVDE